jgi:hypothetical protein
LSYAVSTVLFASAATWNFDLQSDGEDDVAEESVAVGDPVGDAVGDALCEAVALGDAEAEALALGLAEPDGLGLASVRVIVVTPFCTVAVTSAPVVPTRNTPAKTPDLACRNSWNRRSNMRLMPPLFPSNE